MGLAAVLLAVAVLAPATAEAIGRKKADKIARGILKPAKRDGRVVLLRDKKPVKRGKAVFEAFAKNSARSDKIKVAELKRPAWLYWLDLEHGARFQHRSQMLLIDKRSGDVVARQRLLSWPVVGGKPPKFLGKNLAKYTSPPRSAVLFSSVRLSSLRSRAAQPAPQATPAKPATSPHLAPDAFKNDCVVSIGLRKDEQARQDFSGIDGLHGVNGLRTFKIFDAGTDLDGDGKNDIIEEPDGKDLKDAVAALIPMNCKDIMIYISGHGAEKGIPRVQVGHRLKKAGTKTVKDKKTGKPRKVQLWKRKSRYVTQEHLTAILDAFPETTFKFKIDSCYSGRFIDEIPLEDYPNLLVHEVSSSDNEVSWFYLPSVEVKNPDGSKTTRASDTDNPGNQPGNKYGRSEFTNGNLAGIDRWLKSEAEVDAAVAHGGSTFARMLERSFTLGASEDFARKTGKTNPILVSNIPGNPAPVLECNDGVDNDGDGEIDGNDASCLSTTADASENGVPAAFTCPADGQADVGFAFDFPLDPDAAGPTWAAALLDGSSGEPLNVTPIDHSGGAFYVPPDGLGDSVCGPGTIATIEVEPGPTAGSLTYTITVSDEPGGGCCQEAELELAQGECFPGQVEVCDGLAQEPLCGDGFDNDGDGGIDGGDGGCVDTTYDDRETDGGDRDWPATCAGDGATLQDPVEFELGADMAGDPLDVYGFMLSAGVGGHIVVLSDWDGSQVALDMGIELCGDGTESAILAGVGPDAPVGGPLPPGTIQLVLDSEDTPSDGNCCQLPDFAIELGECDTLHTGLDCAAAPTYVTQCTDGLDNDADLRTDFDPPPGNADPATHDAACNGTHDNSESPDPDFDLYFIEVTPFGGTTYDIEVVANGPIGDDTNVGLEPGHSLSGSQTIFECLSSSFTTTVATCLQAKDLMVMIFRLQLASAVSSGTTFGTANVNGPGAASVSGPVVAP